MIITIKKDCYNSFAKGGDVRPFLEVTGNYFSKQTSAYDHAAP